MRKVQPHSLAAKSLHWGFIVVFLYALSKQLDEVEELEAPGLLQYEMAFAVVFLLLVGARFAFMGSSRPTALPDGTPKRERLLARACHLGMYVSLALIPMSGLCIGGLYWSGVKQGAAMDASLLVHEIAVNTLYTLIVIHVAAALYHRYQGDGVWDAMVPVWRERPANPDQENRLSN